MALGRRSPPNDRFEEERFDRQVGDHFPIRSRYSCDTLFRDSLLLSIILGENVEPLAREIIELISFCNYIRVEK